MTEESARPLRAVIGDGVRRVRESTGTRQDDVARAARSHGLAWDRPRIGALERGEKAINADEMALLPLVMTSACGRPVHLPELIDPEAEIQVGDLVMPGRSLIELYAGRPVLTMRNRRLSTDEWVQRAMKQTAENITAMIDQFQKQGAEAIKGLSERLDKWAESIAPATDRAEQLGLGTSVAARFGTTTIPAGQVSTDDVLTWTRAAGEAEEKAGRRLGEHSIVVAALSHALWGWTLSDERDRRVSERADAGDDPARLRALRGRVTRQLVDELAAEIKRREETGGIHEERPETT